MLYLYDQITGITKLSKCAYYNGAIVLRKCGYYKKVLNMEMKLNLREFVLFTIFGY